jgi:tRNA G37 N-methylase TrmD
MPQAEASCVQVNDQIVLHAGQIEKVDERLVYSSIASFISVHD